MKIAAITGSFNPVTQGHIYLLKNALCLFDKVYVVMLINPDKKYDVSPEQRFDRLKLAVKGYDGAEAAYYDGYACDFCKSVGATVMVRGLRDAADLKYELDLRRQNLDYGGIDTMFLLTDGSHRYVSSTKERERALRDTEE